ncbi:MAG TPA: glycosyltransferase family 2 protein [Deinococcales bacterium]|nr:glycosyltransferase family 2 protein [Deinococcales bacterium]
MTARRHDSTRAGWPEVGILIPAFNEQDTVAEVARIAASAHLGPVLVVSDGSSDATVDRARAAGVRVLDLKDNRGKGGAVAAGLRELDSPIVALLDADLVGLRPEHIVALVEPVASGVADTTIGLFSDGRARTDLAQKIAPYLSGQRAIRRDVLLDIEGLAESKFAIELAITHKIEDEGLSVRYVPLPGVAQVMKEEKLGFWRGARRRLMMYGQILRYAFRAGAARASREG